MSDSSPSADPIVLPKKRKKASPKAPPRYKVILLNDDFTPMEFVVDILQKFFQKTSPEAEQIMLKIHRQGKGLCGLFPFAIAETKAYEVMEEARLNAFPLRCTIEPEALEKP